MKNAEWMLKKGYNFTDLVVKSHKPDVYKIYINEKYLATYYIEDKIADREILQKWLDEEHESIIGWKERSLLAEIIKPFREEVACIIKTDFWNSPHYYYIVIRFIDTSSVVYIPCTRGSDAFKNMKENKLYTLDELDL